MAGAYLGFLSMEHAQECCYSPTPLDGMLVHGRVTPSSMLLVPTNLYTWVKGGGGGGGGGVGETKWSKIPCLRKQCDRRVRLQP